MELGKTIKSQNLHLEGTVLGGQSEGDYFSGKEKGRRAKMGTKVQINGICRHDARERASPRREQPRKASQ